MFVQKSLADDDINYFSSRDVALEKTQELLRSMRQRQAVINTSAEARKADEYAGNVVGEHNKQELYDISANLMSWLMQLAQSDPDRAAELIKAAQRDPAGFYKSIPAADRENIKNLSQKVPAKKQP